MAATSPFASPNEPGQRRADRRDLPTGTLTLLFTDIQGSTYLLQQLGEHYASALSECRDLLRAAFGGHHGHEVDAQGDAFFVAFARASDALAAAVAAQRALTTHPWTEGVPVRVRSIASRTYNVQAACTSCSLRTCPPISQRSRPLMSALTICQSSLLLSSGESRKWRLFRTSFTVRTCVW